MSDLAVPVHPKKLPWNQALVVFAEELYAEPKVEAWCLELQDKYHVNVNILLWSFWLQNEGLQISSYWLDDVLITIDTTSQLTVSRLREVRRLVKTNEAFTKVQAQQVCKHILNAEISAERILLKRLEDLSLRFMKAKPFMETSGPITPEYYLGFLGVKDIYSPVAEITSHIAKFS